MNLCAPHIQKVDLRQLSFDRLSRAHDPSCVEKIEEELLLRDQADEPTDHKIYFRDEQIEEIAAMIVNNHTILQEVGWDQSQIEMIGKDLTKRLKRMANNLYLSTLDTITPRLCIRCICLIIHCIFYQV